MYEVMRVILNLEQQASFNRIMRGWVMANDRIQRGMQHNGDLIVLVDGNTICFNLANFSKAYREKFILNNFELYCTQLFLAVKPQIQVFLKNEGFRSYDFQCVFLLQDMTWSKMEKVGSYGTNLFLP
ncbi:hypothetical protein SAMN04488524_0674 [Pedobacter africanus]|uniref:Uncharacterized protein n=2 Tax=Pedobacter africanus TaxID=151894 RepID=A0A1W1ZF45_9SPHI|nr:hypothetical protein SAMN04488524_0674 [Pedobacter africanus]